jgi:hypothetical protein
MSFYKTLHSELPMGFKNCLPKCGRSHDSSPSSKAKLESEREQVCCKCNKAQSVAKDATVFVCTSCHSVNRLTAAEVSATVVSTPVVHESTPHELVSLRRINSSTFVPFEDGPVSKADVSSVPQVASDQASVNSIGPCSICLDAPGDMIFQDCNHGGFCEACARHIAGNNAVGGAFCVKCRSPILSVVRIVELDKDVVRAVTVEVQTDPARTNKGPPKVPPPRGFNKAKKQ